MLTLTSDVSTLVHTRAIPQEKSDHANGCCANTPPLKAAASCPIAPVRYTGRENIVFLYKKNCLLCARMCSRQPCPPCFGRRGYSTPEGKRATNTYIRSTWLLCPRVQQMRMDAGCVACILYVTYKIEMFSDAPQTDTVCASICSGDLILCTVV